MEYGHRILAKILLKSTTTLLHWVLCECFFLFQTILQYPSPSHLWSNSPRSLAQYPSLSRRSPPSLSLFPFAPYPTQDGSPSSIEFGWRWKRIIPPNKFGASPNQLGGALVLTWYVPVLVHLLIKDCAHLTKCIASWLYISNLNNSS